MNFFLVFVVIVCSSILLFYGLGNGALTDYDEATYGHVVNETLKSGKFGTLKHSVSGNWFEKPPLYFWLAMFSQKVFSNPEFALRFPSAFFGLLSIALTMLIAFHIGKNYYIAAFAGAILATTPIFIEGARQVRLDIPVTAAILFSFYCFLKGQEKPKWFLGVGIGAAIGFMLKSVIGFFVFPLIIIWGVVHKNWQWLKNPYIWIGGIAMIALLIPWHLHESVQFGKQFWNEYLARHIFRRFSQSGISGNVSRLEYIKFLFLFGAPWIIIFIAGLSKIPTYFRHHDELAKNILASTCAAIFIFFIFAISKTRLFYYILPMFPFLALTVSFTYKNVYGLVGKSVKKWMQIGLVTTLMLGTTNTIYVAARKQEYLRINQLVANEEKKVGLELAKDIAEIKTYTFDYPYHETIRYYSEGKILEEIKSDQELKESFFVIMRKPLFDASLFPVALAERLRPIYAGKTVILLRFD